MICQLRTDPGPPLSSGNALLISCRAHEAVPRARDSVSVIAGSFALHGRLDRVLAGLGILSRGRERTRRPLSSWIRSLPPGLQDLDDGLRLSRLHARGPSVLFVLC